MLLLEFPIPQLVSQSLRQAAAIIGLLKKVAARQHCVTATVKPEMYMRCFGYRMPWDWLRGTMIVVEPKLKDLGVIVPLK